MEMMPTVVELDELPEQFTLPFQDLSDSPLVEFSGGSTTSNHYTPPPQSHFLHRYPPSVIMPSSPHVRTLRGNWFQQKPDSVEAMREMIFRMAALQPVQIDPESVKPPKRRNVKISKDPQSIAARHRRERISERIRILQRLVPGGTKMDTASMLDEAAHYMKFLKKQVQSLELAATAGGGTGAGAGVGMPAKASVPPPAPNAVGCCPTSNHHGTTNHSNLVSRAGSWQPAAHMIGSMELLR